MSEQSTVLLSGYYGSQNVGDDLLLETVVSMLTNRTDISKINVVVRDERFISKDISTKVSVIELPKFSKSSFLRAVQRIKFEYKQLRLADILIYGGGTRLFETEQSGYTPLLFKYILLMGNRLMLRRPIIHLGVGIGSIETRVGQWLLKRILMLSHKLLLRDVKSWQMAKEITNDDSKIVLGSDLALLYNRTFGDIRSRPDSINIGLSLFQYYGYIGSDVSKADGFLSNCQLFIRNLVAAIPNVKIYLFSFQKDIGGKDEHYNSELITSLNMGDRLKHIRYSSNTNSILSILKTMDICVGMRYHFCLMALKFGIPTIGINYQPKLRNEYRDLGIDDLCLEVDQIRDATPLVNKLVNDDDGNYTSRFNDVLRRIEERAKGLETKAIRILDEFLQK